MKKIAIFALAAMALFTSCDLLDNKPYDTYTKDNFFTSEANVRLFCNYFYSEFSGYGGEFYFNKLNDDQAKTGIEPWTFMQVPASASAWNTPLNQIRRCNTLIAKLEEGIEGMDEPRTKHYIGLGRLMRAWHHYKMVRGFGDCYWIDHEIDPEEPLVYGARQDRDMIMDHVLEDLNYACENMTLDASSRVSFNKFVALAMKAEICLYEGEFRKYRVEADGQKAPDKAGAEKFLKECADACKTIVESGKFSLTPKYADVYKSLNLEGNPEMILYKHYAYPQMAHSVVDYTCGSTQVDGINKACFNSYLSSKGKLMEYGDDHGELIDGKPSMENQIKARDPRLAVHIDNLLQYKGNAVVRFAGNDFAAKNAAASTSSTGYGVAKFDTELLDVEHRQSIGKGDTDAPIFWYAVILLNYAESVAELQDMGVAGYVFDDVKGITLKPLRARAGISGTGIAFLYNFSDPRNNMGVSDLLWEIRRERRVELMFDKNDRYYSLLRWHQLDKLDTRMYPDQTKGAWIAGLVDDISKCDGVTYPYVDAEGYIDVHNGAEDRTYDPKYYLFPIPSGQIILNDSLTQNPGW